MQKWEYRVKWYGESEEEAKARLADGEPTDDELMGFEDGEEECLPLRRYKNCQMT